MAGEPTHSLYYLDIATKLRQVEPDGNWTPAQGNTYLSELVKRGILERLTRGYYDFREPIFSAYIRHLGRVGQRPPPLN